MSDAVGRRPRLLMVVNDAAFLRSHRWRLALAAIQAGWGVEVAAAPGPALDWIRQQGIPIHPVPFLRRGIHPWGELNTLVALVRLYRKLRPELVHHITIKPILYGGFAARWLRLPAVIHAVTGLGFIFSRTGLRARIAQRAVQSAYRYSLADPHSITIFQNPDDLAELWGSGGHPSAVIIPGAGVDPDEFSATEESEELPLVVLASRMLWSKGVGEFVEAARICKDRGIPCRFALIGETDPGNPEAIPRRVLQQWNEAKVVEWWGFRGDMHEVFRLSHVVVLPTTYREGIPKVLIEAASSTRALIATDMPGCREIVRDGENGILIPPRDPSALADAISQLVSDRSLRIKMGKCGRIMVIEKFSLAKIIAATLAQYQAIISKNLK